MGRQVVGGGGGGAGLGRHGGGGGGGVVAGDHAGRGARGELLKGEGAGPRRKVLAADVRWKILKRDRYRCVACGKSPATEPGVELEVDHIVPVARGGGNEEINLRTLCG